MRTLKYVEFMSLDSFASKNNSIKTFESILVNIDESFSLERLDSISLIKPLEVFIKVDFDDLAVIEKVFAKFFIMKNVSKVHVLFPYENLTDLDFIEKVFPIFNKFLVTSLFLVLDDLKYVTNSVIKLLHLLSESFDLMVRFLINIDGNHDFNTVKDFFVFTEKFNLVSLFPEDFLLDFKSNILFPIYSINGVDVYTLGDSIVKMGNKKLIIV